MICVSLEDTKHLEAADTVINGGQFAIICRPNVGDEEGQIENYKTNLNLKMKPTQLGQFGHSYGNWDLLGKV